MSRFILDTPFNSVVLDSVVFSGVLLWGYFCVFVLVFGVVVIGCLVSMVRRGLWCKCLVFLGDGLCGVELVGCTCISVLWFVLRFYRGQV